MENQSGYASWLWILKFWAIIYPVLILTGVLVGVFIDSAFYWTVQLIGIPLLVAPITYLNLVGGGCSLRFQICALVKGVIAGIAFATFTLVTDWIIWTIMGNSLGWNVLNNPRSLWAMYQLWLIGGMIGGFGARIMEVRGQMKSNTQPLKPVRVELE